MELWQRFTFRARRSILIAHDEATQMHVRLIGTEHLLLGLIRMGEGGAVEILRSLDVDPSRIHAELRHSMEMGSEDEPTNELSFTPEAERILRLAYQQAREMNQAHIGTEHLLLALAHDDGGAAYRELRKHGVDAAAVRRAILARAAASDADLPAHEGGRWDLGARALQQMLQEIAEALETASQRVTEAGELLQELEELVQERVDAGTITDGDTMDKQALSSDRIPPAVGPYSQAVRAGEFIFCSGVVGLSPETGKLVEGAFADEVRQVMNNLGALLEDCGSGLSRVVKTTVFLADMAQFQEFNAIYAEYFDDAPPARSTIQVAALPLGARLEVEAIALG